MRSGLLSKVVAIACRTQHSGLVATAVVTGGLMTHAVAQEVTPQLGPAQEFRKAEPGKVIFYSKSGQEYESAPPFAAAAPDAKPMPTKPQPYQRSGAQPPLKNYYTELFATEPAGSAPSGVVQAGMTQQVSPAGGVQTIPTTLTETAEPVLHTDYQVDANQKSAGQIIPAGATTADLPEWARGMKSQAQPQVQVQPQTAAGPALTTEITPVSASLPVLKMETTPAAATPAVAPTLPSQLAPAVALGEIPAGAQTPSVKIEWKAGYDINVGQECECELQVSNAGTSTAHAVIVESTFPSTVRLLDATPKPKAVGNSLVWELGKLEESQKQSIKIKLIPSERGPLAATAQVHFTGAAQSSFVVREPLLGLEMEGPQQVMVGDPASHSVTILNPGNGIAKNVRLEAIIPEGLEHARGERLIMDVGSLNPGEARTIRLALAAVAGGNQIVQVSASAEGGLLKTADATVNVVSPSLQATIDGPGLRYKGRSATYTVRVTNDGSVGTNNVRLMHKVPDGFKFVSADRGATFDGPTRILSWFVGRLEAGKAAEMQVELTAEAMGDFVHYIRATSEHGSAVDSQLATRVEGASALLLEIADLDDPVEVGSETAYEVTILNEGSVAAEEVGLSCELPQGVQFVKAEGPVQHVVDGNLILFQPLASIEPGKSRKFRVHVVGNVEGNLRFRARMTSSNTKEPLTFEELTRFYGDQQ